MIKELSLKSFGERRGTITHVSVLQGILNTLRITFEGDLNPDCFVRWGFK